METEKIYNHHVPCFYLRAWANDNRIWWSGYGKIQCSELTVVGGENYFYKLQELTDEDAVLGRGLIGRSPEGSKKIHENFLSSFSLPPALKRDAVRLGVLDADAMLKLDTAIVNTNEDYQTAIENSFRPYLQSMLFLVVDITVRNDDNTPSTIPPFKLIQPGGGANGQDQEFEAKETFMDCQLSAVKTLNPGVQKRGCIVFDAPWNYYNLQFSGGYESGKVANVWIHDNIDSDAPRYYKEEAPEKAILR